MQQIFATDLVTNLLIGNKANAVVIGFIFSRFPATKKARKQERKKKANKLAVNINFTNLLAAKHSSEEHEEDFSIIDSSAESRDSREVSFVHLQEKNGINPSSRLLLVHLFCFCFPKLCIIRVGSRQLSLELHDHFCRLLYDRGYKSETRVAAGRTSEALQGRVLGRRRSLRLDNSCSAAGALL